MNVGGVLYATSKTTLTKFSDSMLTKICEKDGQNGKGSSRENPIVIDRSGEKFKYVLEFLRTDSWFNLPDVADVGLLFFKDLFAEAHFYGIEALCDLVHHSVLLPNKIWVSPTGFQPEVGQEVVLVERPDEFVMRLARFSALPQHVVGDMNGIVIPPSCLSDSFWLCSAEHRRVYYTAKYGSVFKLLTNIYL